MPADAHPSASVRSALARGVRQREHTRAAVIDAAEALWARSRAEEIRIEDVAAHAGVSPASIYLHFGTKDALIAAVMNRLLDLVTNTLAEAYQAPVDPAQRVEGIGLAYLKLMLKHPALMKYLAATGERQPLSDEERLVDERLGALRQQFEDRIQEAAEQASNSQVDARLMSYFFWGAWNGVASLVLRRDGLALSDTDVDAAIRQAGTALMAGLGIAPTGTPGA